MYYCPVIYYGIMFCGQAPGLRLGTSAESKNRPKSFTHSRLPPGHAAAFPRCFSIASIGLDNSNLRALIGPAETWFTRRRGPTRRTLAIYRDAQHRQYGSIEPSMQGREGQGRSEKLRCQCAEYMSG